MILNIYKEKNWTSFDVVAKLRGILKTKKIGHAGTLDPLAEGVLIILTEEDTKKQSEIMKLEKEYEAEVTFGATSPTYDLEGKLFYLKGKDFENLKEKIEKILSKYIGEYEQKVPSFSATKVGGQRLYRKAGKKDFDKNILPSKKVYTKSITLEDFGNKNLKGKNLPFAKFQIVCEKGFYVRSFAHDLGENLGTGAILSNLTRTRIGNYTLKDSKKISEIS